MKIFKIFATIGLLQIVTLWGCTKEETIPEGFDIPFEEIEHYFVLNSYAQTLDSLLTFLIINDTATLNSIYHPAPSWGSPDHWIGPEDFEDNFLVGIIREISNDIYRFIPKRVYLLNDTLNIKYKSKLIEKNASYSIKCHLMLLIENCPYQGIIFYENDEIVKQLK